MQIIENRALQLRVRDPQRITSVIPCSKQIGDHDVLVKWGLEEVQVLKNLNIKNIPSPILRGYDWPGLYVPFAHQRTTAEFLTLHRRAFCFNSQGTGKTASVIWAADYLMKLKKIRRVLVVCPVSIMGSAWQNDLFQFAMHRSCEIAHHPQADKRRKIIRGNAEFVVINYDGLAIVADAVRETDNFDLIVVDECFVAGSQVLTPHGQVPIEFLKAGDLVLTSAGEKRIRRLVRKQASTLVEVKLSNGKTITCTPEHPFFTDVGWTRADALAGRRLVHTDALRRVRAGIHHSTAQMGLAPCEGDADWESLLTILRSEEVPHAEPGYELLQPHAARTTGTTHEGVCKDTGDSTTHLATLEGNWASPRSTRGKWDWYDPSRDACGASASEGVCLELPGSVGWEATRLSYELQTRLRASREENRFGGGRGFAHFHGAAGTGQEENGPTIGPWVESVSYYQQGGDTPVFNLEVEDVPNYFVEGCLVHNCNAYKNHTNQRWRTLVSLIKPSTWVWMMTGTPASQSPVDAYGLAKIINPSGVPKLFGAFRDSVMQQVTRFKYIPKPNASEIVFKALQPAIRFTKEECLDLPDMMYAMRDVELTPQQEEYYETFIKQQMVVAAGEEITAPNAAAMLNKLLQISSGAVYTDSKDVVEFDCRNRLAAMKEVIDEASHKVLVFVPYTHSLEMVSDWLTKQKITNRIINGKVPPNKRTEIFNQFQTTPEPRVLVIQPQAASHGVTLHAANVIIYWSPVMSVETYLQANARVHRAGQVNKVTVVHLQGSRVERRMYRMLQNKIDIHQRLVDLYKEELGEITITGDA